MTTAQDMNHERPAGDAMNSEQLAEAKQYGRQEFACDLMDHGIDLAYLAIAAVFLARPIDSWLAHAGLEADWLRLIGMYVVVTALHMACSFPLSYYSGHILEHRYGLSTQTFGGWLWRYVKRNGLALVLGALLIQGLYWMIWLSGDIWWLLAACGFFLVSIVLGQLAPVLILPLFYKITKLDDPSLAARFAHLCRGTGLTIEGVYRMELSSETVKANAMLAGLGNTRRVLMGDTLLNGFSSEEIDVIFAHEIGHHVHRHILKMVGAGLLYSAGAFFVCDRLLTWWLQQSDGGFSYHAFPVYSLPMLTLCFTALSLVLQPLQNMVSRHFERQSDWYALRTTNDPQAYRSAFQKLAKMNKADPDPHPLEVLLFHSHPPISERLAMADRL